MKSLKKERKAPKERKNKVWGNVHVNYSLNYKLNYSLFCLLSYKYYKTFLNLVSTTQK